MRSFQIKVCGLTRLQDAEIAARLGVDMVGLIFYRKSLRCVSPATAAKIVKALPPTVDAVGVFVDEQIERVLQIAARLGLRFVQCHGGERATYVRSLQRSGLRVIKAFTVRSRSDCMTLYRSPADLVMLDNREAEVMGGTGQRFDWSIKPPRRIPNLVLSGGLNAANIAEGVKRFSPLVVDVNSGVETRPGMKSKRKLTAFIRECNRIRYGR